MESGTPSLHSHGRPVIFGEVLFDRFEDGAAVLGGAPFNVAWHLQGFGLAPLLVSRIGEDALGERVLEAMREWGMDTRGIQRDPVHPTGTVEITLEAGQPHFEILDQQAYDFIDAATAEALLPMNEWSLLYHGTLALRNPASREALARLRAAAALPAFIDVNLRPPWWQAESVVELLADGRWAKLNDDELGTLEHSKTDRDALLQAGRDLRNRHDLEALIITRGAEGAMLLGAEEEVEGAPVRVDAIKDTVGAGDAFSAVTIVGLLRGWPLEQVLARAMQFAATLCRHRGATLDDRSIYEQLLKQWGR